MAEPAVRSLLAFPVLFVLALSTPARADTAGNGTFQVQVVPNTLSASGTGTFAAGTHDVFGTPVDLGSAVGAFTFTATAQTIFDVSHGTFTLHAESTTPGLLSFDGAGELVCDPNCAIGTGSFVVKVTAISGSVALPAAIYTFDGTVNLSLGSGSGTFALNAFQACALPAGEDIDVSCDGNFQNTFPPGAEQAFAVDAFFPVVPQSGSLVVLGLSNAGGDLPAGLRPLYDPPAFIDVSTTVATAGSVQVCLHYVDDDQDEVEDVSGVPARLLRVLHRSSVDGAFVDVTETLDTANARVCGSVLALSPFLLAAKPCQSSEDCLDADPCTDEVCSEGLCSYPSLPDCTSTTTTTESTTTTTIASTTTTTAASSSTTATTTTSTTTTDTSLPTTTTTTSTTTTTTAPSTSSTTETTTTSTTTTDTSVPTTTTLPGCVVAPTIESIKCRLDALIAKVSASSDLGAFQPRLLKQLTKARARVGAAEQLLADGQRRSAQGKLKNAFRWLSSFGHRLGSLAARAQLDSTVRQALIDMAEPIQADLRTLIHSR